MTDDRTCTGSQEMWTFDMKEGRCSRINFDGCDPTENLFETEEECVERCVGEPEETTTEKPAENESGGEETVNESVDPAGPPETSDSTETSSVKPESGDTPKHS